MANLTTYLKSKCGTPRNRIVTMERGERKFYVMINYDSHTSQCFDLTNEGLTKAYKCYDDLCERMGLTSIDESVHNIQRK